MSPFVQGWNKILKTGEPKTFCMSAFDVIGAFSFFAFTFFIGFLCCLFYGLTPEIKMD